MFKSKILIIPSGVIVTCDVTLSFPINVRHLQATCACVEGGWGWVCPNDLLSCTRDHAPLPLLEDKGTRPREVISEGWGKMDPRCTKASERVWSTPPPPPPRGPSYLRLWSNSNACLPCCWETGVVVGDWRGALRPAPNTKPFAWSLHFHHSIPVPHTEHSSGLNWVTSPSVGFLPLSLSCSWPKDQEELETRRRMRAVVWWGAGRRERPRQLTDDLSKFPASLFPASLMTSVNESFFHIKV